MGDDGAPPAGEGQVCLGGDVLFPEGEDEVLEEQLFQGGKSGVVEGLSQVDSGDGRPQRSGLGSDVDIGCRVRRGRMVIR